MSKKRDDCNKFFYDLAEILYASYEIIGSINKDFSRYLVPFGTDNQITYYSKPAFSFRISDHWNWYSSLKKCKNEFYVQCNSVDMPVARRRANSSWVSEPHCGIQVAFCDRVGIYHHVYGEKYDRRTRKWSWVENDPIKVVEKYLY